MTDRKPRLRQRATRPDIEAYAHYRQAIATRTLPDEGPTRLLAALALILSVVVLAGALGPWMRFEELGGNTVAAGVRTDGAVVAIAGAVAIVAFGVALARPGNVPAALTGLIAAAAAALIGSYSWMIFDQAILGYEETSRITHAETGWGLPLTTAAGVTATIVAVAHLRRVENS